MMHPIFAPLDERNLGLLLVMALHGGGAPNEISSLLKYLPQEQAQLLNQKLQAIEQIPGGHREHFLRLELKSAVSSNGLNGMDKVDPSWIIDALHGDPANVVALILTQLPARLLRSVLRRLPPGIRSTLPPREEAMAVHPTLRQELRWVLEARFHSMPAAPGSPFRFCDVVHLERSELYLLIRDLGLTEVGQAFICVGKMALIELCRRLPRRDADELVHAVQVASRVDLPDAKTAQRFLARVVANFSNTEEFLQKSGLWRLAKGLLGEPVNIHNQFAQRLPRHAAQELRLYLEKASEIADISPETQQRVQDAVLVRLVVLAHQGAINPRWANTEIFYHDPDSAQAAIQASTATNNPDPAPGNALPDALFVKS